MSTGEIVALSGSAASLLFTVIGGAMAWQRIRDRSDENKRRIEELEARCEDYDKFSVSLASLSTDLKWIGQSIEEVRNGRGNNHRK